MPAPTYEQNGSLRVVAQNGDGGRIDTTLNPQGKGVNVDVTAHDVDLGGALVNGDERQPHPVPASGPVLVPGPITGPISGGPIMAPISGPISGQPIPSPYSASDPFAEPRPV